MARIGSKDDAKRCSFRVLEDKKSGVNSDNFLQAMGTVNPALLRYTPVLNVQP